jgi:hypothetical protein
MQKSLVDSILDLRSFVNRKDVSASHVGFLLGKPKAAHMFGAYRVKPFDNRFLSIMVNMKPGNFNVIRYLVFTCVENSPVGLAEMTEKLGPFEASYNEEKNSTQLTCTNFEESELLEAISCVINGFRLDNHPDGLLLHQPGGGTVVVPLSEIQVPEFTFMFKEFERPVDKSGKNPIFAN